MRARFDIAIAGGGIGGVVLAELLARRGKRAVVIERSTGPPPFTRPEILWPATVEALCRLRDRDFWEREGCMLELHGIMTDFGGRLEPFMTEETFRAAGITPVSVEPNRLREVLLRECSADVRRGVSVCGVLEDVDRICGLRVRPSDCAPDAGDEEIEADWVVGDDGTHSLVRKATGIPIQLERFPADFFVRRFAWPDGWPAGVGRVFVAPRGDRRGLRACGLLPQGIGQAAAVALVDADAADDATALKEQWAAMLAGSPNISPEMRDVEFPGDFARIRREFGHAERYGSGAVVLMGDALHPVSPAGGQGANMSVADALALAEILPDGGPDVIERYESLRRRANARSLRVTAGAARLLASDAGAVTRTLGRLIISLLVGHPRLMRWPVRFLASAFRSPDGAPTMPSRRR